MDIRLYQLLEDLQILEEKKYINEQAWEDFGKNEDAYLEKMGIIPTTYNCYSFGDENRKDNHFILTDIYGVEYDIKQIRKLSRAIAEICVAKKLPSGDPCWMAWLIGSYIEIPPVDHSNDWM